MWIKEFFISVVLAQGGSYTLLEPLPGMSATEPVTVAGYLSALFQFGIILGAILAVFMIVYGGIMHMTAAGNPGQVDKAKGVIWSAIWGLGLVLVAYLVLKIINPNLVNWDSNFFK